METRCRGRCFDHTKVHEGPKWEETCRVYICIRV